MFSRFIVSGGVAALVNVSLRYLLNFIVPFGWAVVFAYICGMLTAYLLARTFVFTRSGSTNASTLKRFTIVNMGSLAIVWIVSVVLAKAVFPALAFTWHANDIAHVTGVCATAFSSYFAHKNWSFK
jgi:putative flippase GtrA